MPFPPSLNTAPADDARASASLALNLHGSAMSHCEVCVNGSQTLRLTVFQDWESGTDAGRMDYTREVTALFAPPRLVASLAISGGELGREDRVGALLVDLPHLTHLAITASPDGRLEGEGLSVLERPGPDGEVLCLSLEHLSLPWLHTSDRLAWAQDRLSGRRGFRRLTLTCRRCMVGRSPGLPHFHGQRRIGDPKTWRPYGGLSSYAFCQTVASVPGWTSSARDRSAAESRNLHMQA